MSLHYPALNNTNLPPVAFAPAGPAPLAGGKPFLRPASAGNAWGGLPVTPPLAHLMEALATLPGVGPKTAQRYAFHLLREQNSEQALQLAQAIVHATEAIGACSVCNHLSAQNPCELCTAPNRNNHKLCVVADPREVFALERTHQFDGRYHILGGVIAPLDGVGPEQLKIRELLNRLSSKENASSDDSNAVMEVILALPPTTEGDTTSLYLARLLKPLGVKVSRIAFGLPVGGDLDYADNLTLSRALQGRNTL